MRTSTAATLGMLTLALGAGILTFRNFQQAGQPGAGAESQESPRYTLSKVRWTRLDVNGQPEYVAKAASLEYFDNRSSQLLAPEVSAFGGNGSPWHLTAPEGSSPARSRNLQLTGNVRVTGRWQNGSEIQFDTPYLWLDAEQNQLRTDAPVVMTSTGRKLMATGFIADAAGREVKLLNKVRGEYEPQS